MKRLMFALLAGASIVAAAGQALATEDLPVEHYSYSTHLDIARVVSVGAIPNVCEVVPVRMVYDDSNGQRHTLEYQVMGTGCVD